MEEPPPVLDSPRDATPPPATSLAARLLNVFAVPGEVFAEVKVGRICIGNWLVPALLSALVAVFTAVVIVSHPAFQRQLHDLTERQAKAVDQQVKAGKVKQADANRALALVRAITQPGSIKTLASMAVAVVGFARVFWWAFILWLLGRLFLKVRFGYPKALEVAGLGLMISVLGTVVTLLLMVKLPSLFAAQDLALAVSDFDASRKSPLLLGAANVFSFWVVGVLAVGLAKLAGVPFLRAAWLVFAAWLIQESCFVLLAGVLGQFAL
jgi:hypothetical protein